MSINLNVTTEMKKSFDDLDQARYNFVIHELNKFIDSLRSKGLHADGLRYISDNLPHGGARRKAPADNTASIFDEL